MNGDRNSKGRVPKEVRDPAPLSRPQGLSGTSPKRSEEPLPRILQACALPSAARLVPPAYTSPSQPPRLA